jgi:hypothetical protein
MVIVFVLVLKFEDAVVLEMADVPFASRGAYDVLVDRPDS